MPPSLPVLAKLRALGPDDHPTLEEFRAACDADGIEWQPRDDRHVPDELARREASVGLVRGGLHMEPPSVPEPRMPPQGRGPGHRRG